MIRYVGDIAYLPAPNPELEALLDSKYPRIPGLLQWRAPDKGILAKAIEFTQTVASGMADDATVQKRLDTCLACPAVILDKAGNKYCSGCRCGTWAFAKLDGTAFPKLKWRSLKCPLGKF